MQCIASSHITANTHYGSGTFIPECNGLSQFIEDTGEPVVKINCVQVLALCQELTLDTVAARMKKTLTVISLLANAKNIFFIICQCYYYFEDLESKDLEVNHH